VDLVSQHYLWQGAKQTTPGTRCDDLLTVPQDDGGLGSCEQSLITIKHGGQVATTNTTATGLMSETLQQHRKCSNEDALNSDGPTSGKRQLV
jgi:hypothetical protein